MSNRPSKQDTVFIGAGMAIGAGVGVALGNIGVGVAVGLVLGVAFARSKRSGPK